jgi:hypothetical protein
MAFPIRPKTVRRSWIRALAALAVTLAAVGGFLVAGEGVAGASCMAPPAVDDAIRQADIVVVGTVSTTRSRGRIATVQVEDVWKGHVASELEVFGGPASENVFTSVDRTYEIGTRYLLFVHEPSAHGYSPTFGGRYEDNSCSDTRPYTNDLAALRPTGATSLEDPDRTHGSAPIAAPTSRSSETHAEWWALLGVAATSVLIVAAFAVRRIRISRRIG